MADGAGSNGDAAGLPVGKEAGEKGGRPAGPREVRCRPVGPLTRRLCPPPRSGPADPGERAHLHRGPVQGVQRPAHLRVPEAGPLPGRERGAAAARRRAPRGAEQPGGRVSLCFLQSKKHANKVRRYLSIHGGEELAHGKKMRLDTKQVRGERRALQA